MGNSEGQFKVLDVDYKIAEEVQSGLGGYLKRMQFDKVIVPLNDCVFTGSAFGGWSGSVIDYGFETYNGCIKYDSSVPWKTFGDLSERYLKKIGEPYVRSPSWL